MAFRERPLLRQITALLILSPKYNTAEELTRVYNLNGTNARELMNQLIELGVAHDKESTQIEIPERLHQEITQLIKDAEHEFITRRDAANKLDVVGRLEWIEDLNEVINNARNNRNETIRKA